MILSSAGMASMHYLAETASINYLVVRATMQAVSAMPAPQPLSWQPVVFTVVQGPILSMAARVTIGYLAMPATTN